MAAAGTCHANTKLAGRSAHSAVEAVYALMANKSIYAKNAEENHYVCTCVREANAKCAMQNNEILINEILQNGYVTTQTRGM